MLAQLCLCGMHVSGYIVVPPARLHRATAAVQAALPKVLSMLLGLGQVKEESRRGNGTVTLGWAPVRPPHTRGTGVPPRAARPN